MITALTKHITRWTLIGTLGLLLIVVTISLLTSVYMGVWRQEQINKWSVEIPLDMSRTNTYVKSFTPATPYYLCYALFSMRGPVTDKLADYRSVSGGNVPDELIRNIFSQMPFKISWSILDGEKEICSGVFLSTDINAWVYPNYVYYSYGHYTIKGNSNLEPDKKYSFIGNVEQSCEPLNQLNPKLEFRRGASFKASGAAIIASLIIIPWFIFGIALLRTAVIKNLLEKKKNQ
jgi:hypothetical protein